MIRASEVMRIGACSGYGGIDNAHAGAAALNCKLYNQDGVLRQQTYKHDQCNLQVDIVGDTEYLREDK